MSEKDYSQQLMAPYAVLGVRGDSETLGCDLLGLLTGVPIAAREAG